MPCLTFTTFVSIAPKVFVNLYVCIFFAAVLVNELNDLPYLHAVGDFDETELQEQDVPLDKELLSNGVLPTNTQGTDSFDNPFLRPAKRARKIANQAEVDWVLVNCRLAGERTITGTISYSTRQIIVNPIRFVLSNQNSRSKCQP